MHIFEEAAVIRTTNMSSLPEEIHVDIFVKLPLKSISMSRCVCKLWYNLLTASKFIKYHLNYNNIQNKNINHKLISITRNSYYIYSTAYDSVSSSPLPSFNKALKVDMVEILGSCDGLICLQIYGSVVGTVGSCYRIYIWNPLTREYKEVIGKPYFEFKPMHGFAYDCIMDTYKLVKLNRYKTTSSFDIHVYTLGSDSWSITRQSQGPYFFPCLHTRYTCGLLFNGALHWCGYKTTPSMSYVILSYDVSTGRVGDVPLPAGQTRVLSNGGQCQRSVAVLGDYLCLFIVDYDYGCLAEIWVMQKYGVQGSWTKQFSITRPDREIIPRFNISSKLVCALENGELLILIDNGKFVKYDPMTKIFRIKQMIFCITQSYVEGLVSINSGTYVGKAS